MYYGAIGSIEQNIAVNTIDNLSDLIEKVDKYELCSGVINGYVAINFSFAF